MRALVGEGADVNAADSRGYNPVFAAAEFGHAAVIHELKTFGADLSQGMTLVGWSPIFVASWGGMAAAVSALLECGVNSKEESSTTKAEHLGVKPGTTPMQVAKDYGHTDVVKILEV